MTSILAEAEEHLPRVVNEITDAVSFMQEFQDEFELADAYYNGETSIPIVDGRSRAVATHVRDAIRGMRPSIMRVLCSNREQIVKYRPSKIAFAAIINQQAAYIHQLFWKSGGYMTMYNMIDESLRHKFGPVKTSWIPDPAPVYTKMTGLKLEEVNAIAELPGVTVLNVELHEPANKDAVPNSGDNPAVDLYDMEIAKATSNGRIVCEAIPYGEFFISRNATNTSDAAVHGHRRSVSVAEAMEMGINWDDWDALDDVDPLRDEVSSQFSKKVGHQRTGSLNAVDELAKTFLLTECYVKLDLTDSGYLQTYRLWLGGSAYTLLGVERIEETPCDICVHDINSFSPLGYCVYDVLGPSQDTNTSLLRGMLDNLHATNNPRLAANPNHVNFDDLMNFQIGHPLRLKTTMATVQVVSIPSNIQQALPMLQWLEQDATNKIGITKAAQGLDPNAMQSTDKDAVRNTIQLSQGQVELAVRNIIETAIIPIFRKMLKLSMQHMDKEQIVITQGMCLPVDTSMFDTDYYAEPMVGLGTASQEQRMMGLQATLGQQMSMMQQLGMNNPFVTASHIYNTVEDLTRMYGIDDVGRYFNQVTPAGEAAFAKQKAEEAAKASPPPPDPTTALIQIEQMKSETKKQADMQSAQNDQMKLFLAAATAAAQDDLARDKLAQDRAIAAAKLLVDGAAVLDQNQIKREQDAARANQAASPPQSSLGMGTPNGAR